MNRVLGNMKDMVDDAAQYCQPPIEIIANLAPDDTDTPGIAILRQNIADHLSTATRHTLYLAGVAAASIATKVAGLDVLSHLIYLQGGYEFVRACRAYGRAVHINQVLVDSGAVTWTVDPSIARADVAAATPPGVE